MPRVLVLFGSPHPDGATAHLLSACLDGMGDITLTRFDAFTTAVAPCDDCGYCREVNGCRHRDLDEFYAALEAAEVLVIATPVYNRAFPAPLKAFLDRLQRYWSARFVRGVRPPIATPKKTVLLTTAGADRADGAKLATQLAPTLTVLNSTPALCVHADSTDRTALTQEVLAAARHAGKTAVG